MKRYLTGKPQRVKTIETAVHLHTWQWNGYYLNAAPGWGALLWSCADCPATKEEMVALSPWWNQHAREMADNELAIEHGVFRHIFTKGHDAQATPDAQPEEAGPRD